MMYVNQLNTDHEYGRPGQLQPHSTALAHKHRHMHTKNDVLLQNNCDQMEWCASIGMLAS